MAKRKNVDVNQDQSAKSQSGLKNNQVNDAHCNKWENGDTRLFIGSELTYSYEQPSYVGIKPASELIQIDQTCIVVNHRIYWTL